MNEQHKHEEESGEDFAALLAASEKTPARMEPGHRIDAKIVKITPEWVFLEIGGKGEGYLNRAELTDAAGNLTAREGDRIRAYFTHSDNGEMHFTVKIGSGPAARAQLEDAMKNGAQVEGTVSKETKGGFEVTLQGGFRAFCPFSHMGIRRDEKKENYLGVSMPFEVLELRGRDAVLSRKNIVDKERRERAEALKASLKEGDRIPGTVTSIQKFGAFVDIGGVEGLLPISELAWNRTEKVEDLLAVGQPVEIVIKRLDWENGKLSFSLKEALPNPWDSAERTWPEGSYHHGKVSRLAPFGAFVTLGPGVDGLVHVSRLGDGEHRVAHPQDVLQVGQELEVRVESVDKKNQRISLVPAEVGRAEEETAATMKQYQKPEASGAPMGAFAEALRAQLDKKKKS